MAGESGGACYTPSVRNGSEVESKRNVSVLKYYISICITLAMDRHGIFLHTVSVMHVIVRKKRATHR